ncbi:MAG: reverse transcriptase domain-containing protein [archaeon]
MLHSSVVSLNSNRNADSSRLNVNGNNWIDNNNGYVLGMALASKAILMKTHKNLYDKIISFDNLILSWKKARKGKTKMRYVIKFEKSLEKNLLDLQFELKNQFYYPQPLTTFILRDPKTRKISKSGFRDRIVHHALVNVIEPIFDKTFIYDSCANRTGKGNLFALKRLYCFARKISENGKVNGIFNNNQVKGHCLKADIKHYFHEVEHKILLTIIKRKITDEKIIWLINQIIKANFRIQREREREIIENKGMPLGNLTSQFFANVYLNELDYFIKHKLRAKYYIRYVDDFVILHKSREQLNIWKQEIGRFLKEKLKLSLHPQKSKTVPLSKGIDFVGFRNFYHKRLLRKRSIRKMFSKVEEYKNNKISKEELLSSFQGWNAYAKWANTLKLRRAFSSKINKSKPLNTPSFF